MGRVVGEALVHSGGWVVGVLLRSEVPASKVGLVFCSQSLGYGLPADVHEVWPAVDVRGDWESSLIEKGHVGIRQFVFVLRPSIAPRRHP